MRSLYLKQQNQLTHKEIMVILGGLMMGMFLAALDQTIVSDSSSRASLKSLMD
jgi:Na+-translocating ferredoxin:NAD+ oxidoreductase RnfC subunit